MENRRSWTTKIYGDNKDKKKDEMTDEAKEELKDETKDEEEDERWEEVNMEKGIQNYHQLHTSIWPCLQHVDGLRVKSHHDWDTFLSSDSPRAF